jgi:hypothetical protein
MTAPLSKTLIGTWELLSREDVTAAGERRVDPALGADPAALLIYDAAGHFSAQFMRRDRSGSVEAADPKAAGPNNSRAVDGYDAYFGRYSVDDTDGTVTQTLTGALSPESVGMTLTRAMTVTGDALVIELDTAAMDGTPVTRTLKWRRVG